MDPYKAVGRAKSARFWHGGAPGLQVGDELLPRRGLDRSGIRYGRRAVEDDASAVYITDNLDVARSYASLLANRAGDVYEVRPVPVSSLRIDEDLDRISLTCARARIVDVVERNVMMTFAEATRPVARHMTWEDGSPIYTEDGYVTVAPNWLNADPRQVASLGAWIPHVAVLYSQATGRCVLSPIVMRQYIAKFPELAEAEGWDVEVATPPHDQAIVSEELDGANEVDSEPPVLEPPVQLSEHRRPWWRRGRPSRRELRKDRHEQDS